MGIELLPPLFEIIAGPGPLERFEYYHGESVWNTHRILRLHGQVFTPQRLHKLNYIVVKGRRYSAGTTLHVCLAKVLANKEPDLIITGGIPSGFLSEAQLDISGWSSSADVEAQVNLSHPQLNAGQKYALIFWTEDAWPNGFQLRTDHISPAGYTRGYEVYYLTSWLIYDGIEEVNSFDQWFEEWGQTI